MQEEPEGPSERAAAAGRGRAPDPSLALPKVLRPSHVAIGGGIVYLLGASFVSAALLVRAADEAGAAIAVWALGGLVFGVPVSVLLARLSHRTESALSGVRPPRGGWWLLFGFGIALSAHWAPLCPWTFVLFGSAALGGFRSDDYVVGAALTSIAWLAVALGFFAAGGAGRMLAARSWADASTHPYAPARLPTSLVVGALYAAAAAPTAALLTAFVLERGWDRELGASALAAWFLLGGAAAALAGGIAGAWLARTPVGPVRSGAAARQLEVAGSVLAWHWAVPFLVALIGDHEPGARMAVLLTCALALLLGTAAWSAGRTARVRASP